MDTGAATADASTSPPSAAFVAGCQIDADYDDDDRETAAGYLRRTGRPFVPSDDVMAALPRASFSQLRLLDSEVRLSSDNDSAVVLARRFRVHVLFARPVGVQLACLGVLPFAAGEVALTACHIKFPKFSGAPVVVVGTAIGLTSSSPVSHKGAPPRSFAVAYHPSRVSDE